MPHGKLPDIFLKERYEKDIKYIRVYDTYTPNYNKTRVTPKFYSKYEGGDVDEVNPEILKNLIRAKDMGPREKLDWPETVNQVYDWYPAPLVEIDRNDPRFYFPRRGTEITRHGLKLMQNKGAKHK